MASNVQMMRDAISGLLESLYDMGADEETVAIAAESQINRESLHSDILLRRLKAAREAMSLPMRNCDMYDAYGDAIRAFEDTENAEDYEEMAEWLLATAAEQKGEGDERR